MKTFLENLASEILSQEGNDFSDLCVVLPNRRAGVFLRAALSKEGKRAIWAPKILSIEDFVFSLSGLTKVDQTTLLFQLYNVYKEHGAGQDSFELYANWAPTFLKDINEVDINLIDAKDIYEQLYSVERISRWNPSGKPQSDFQKNHLEFVQQLHGLYLALSDSLKAKNLAYQGMAFRRVAEHPKEALQQCEWKNIWFAGFNAMTISEEEIIQQFLESGRARIFWDIDDYYSDDPMHEAGFYIRRYLAGQSRLKLDGALKWKSSHFSSESKNIHLIGAQRNVTQAEIAATILQQKLREKGPEGLARTAVVLNDEKLLFPLLNSLPADLQHVNITMGYGLKYSQLVAFFDKLFRLHAHASSANGMLYHKDVISIFTDGIYASVTGETGATRRKQLADLNQAYLSSSSIRQNSFDEILFPSELPSVAGFLKLLREAAKTIAIAWNEREFILESKFLLLVERMLVRLTDLQNEFGLIDSLKTLHVFWQQLINGQQLDFVGEPIGGLQVMGMLETRNLDFEDVILLSVNEGSLPSSSHSPSYFTFDVRRVYGLACQNERDAVTAYHFYRLIQRAKNVHLVFDQDSTSFGSGEVSRYVQQLRLEAPTNVTFHEKSVAQKLPKKAIDNEISIAKGDLEYDVLLKHAERGYSPSALNTYRSCTLKYYMRYVAKFKEDDELAEEVDNATFGTAIHDTLEQLYLSTLGHPLTEKQLQEMTKNIDSVLEGQFAKHVPVAAIKQGKNLLAFEVARAYVKRVLKNDLKSVKNGQPVTVLQLEQKLKGSITVAVNGTELKVNLSGLADRIDRTHDGQIRLIDYKTGSPDKTTIINERSELDKKKADNAFQLLLYQFMYADMTKTHEANPTLFYLRSQEIEKPVTVKEEKVPVEGIELTEYTKTVLSETLQELFSKDIPFSQTEDTDACTYCDFKDMCQR